MDYLARTTSPISETLWAQIDEAVVGVARNVLTGRRFLTLTGPLGSGAASIQIDDAETRQETLEDGFIINKGRRIVEIPTLFEDFQLLARDLTQSEAAGRVADLAPVLRAAQAAALREDRMCTTAAGLIVKTIFTPICPRRIKSASFTAPFARAGG